MQGSRIEVIRQLLPYMDKGGHKEDLNARQRSNAQQECARTYDRMLGAGFGLYDLGSPAASRAMRGGGGCGGTVGLKRQSSQHGGVKRSATNRRRSHGELAHGNSASPRASRGVQTRASDWHCCAP